MNSLRASAALACSLPALLACSRAPSEPGQAGNGLASSSAAVGLPTAKPSSLGTVRGRVRITGDAPPVSASVVAKIPDRCASARDYYGPAFRKTAEGALADALVAVTGYRTEAPAREPTEPVVAANCRWHRRTYALAAGQKLAITAEDPLGYIPLLTGAGSTFSMVPIPGSAPVEILPPKPGRFELVDSVHNFIRADVFVVAYPTFDVTDADGRFAIVKVPAGPARINVLLPVLMLTEEREIVVRAGETVTVDFTLRYDANRSLAASSASPTPVDSTAVPPAPPSAAAP